MTMILAGTRRRGADPAEDVALDLDDALGRGERRAQADHPAAVKPELMATGPNQVYSWDITKLHGPAKWTYYYLYVILDVFSRYVVGWIAVIWIAFIAILFVLPQASPGNTLTTFNYAIVAVAVVLVYAGGYWFLSAKNWFRGPKVQGTSEELAKIEAELAAAG